MAPSKRATPRHVASSSSITATSSPSFFIHLPGSDDSGPIAGRLEREARTVDAGYRPSERERPGISARWVHPRLGVGDRQLILLVDAPYGDADGLGLFGLE